MSPRSATSARIAVVFDLDAFVAECRAAAAHSESRVAIREVLTRAVRSSDDVADELRPTEGGITVLHHAPELTVLHVVWAPHMVLNPHDHRMWAAIGVYSGQEDNAFFRRTGPDKRGLVESGGRQLHEGDVVVFGDDTIHSVTNPADRLTGAIHVYGGDFVNEPRSQWVPGISEERPYDLAATMQQFADANRAWLGRS
jgi:predicted metal-dependent enzyme (double-stranded beta helix superfamily)